MTFHLKCRKQWCFFAVGMWQNADLMSIETAHCPGQIAFLIFFRTVILNFVQVIKTLKDFTFIKKSLMPFFLGIITKYVTSPLFPTPNYIVPFSRIVLIYEGILTSWACGIFTSHLCEGITIRGLWMIAIDALHHVQNEEILGDAWPFVHKLF